MALKVSLTFCFLFILWSSVSSELIVINTPFISRGALKCWSGGAEGFVDEYEIKDLRLKELEFDFFDRNTVVIAHGVIILTTVSDKMILQAELALTKYEEKENVKTYSGQLHSISQKLWMIQEARMHFKLIINQNSRHKFEIHAYAGSWGAMSCAVARADITKITINK